MTATGIPHGTPPPRSGFRRFLAGGCAVVACGALVPGIYLYTASHSRYRVIGPVDPKTGYHIEYTVSRGFVKAAIPPSHRDHDAIEEADFNPRPPSAVARWVSGHLLRRNSVPIPAGSGDEPRVVQFADYTDRMPMDDLVIDDQGYIDMDTSNNQVFGIRVVRRDRRVVSGCPTTFVQVEIPAGGLYQSRIVVSEIMIHPRDASIYYVIAGGDYGDSDAAAVLREASEIAESVRVVPGSAKK